MATKRTISTLDPTQSIASTPIAPKVNYLNNRDILKEIHSSKNTYCYYKNPETDSQYDIILPSLEKINQRTVAEARRNRADRFKRLGTIVDPLKIPNTDLVFRISCWDHIPMAEKKIPKSEQKKKQKLEDLLEFVDDDPIDDSLDDILDKGLINPVRQRLNFPPFEHWRMDENKEKYMVGRSHWKGDLETGEFSKNHGDTYNEEMRGQALLQLSQIGLQFDESKSQNPFAYYTAAITNSFTRILNLEKKSQNIRDDILEINGLSPSWTRQNAGKATMAQLSGPVTITTYIVDKPVVEDPVVELAKVE